MHDPETVKQTPADQGTVRFGASPWAHSIQLITAKELACELRFDGPTSAFRKFCKSAGIEPVPGRRDCYDPVAIRHKLNEIQGLGTSSESGAQGALTRSMMRRNG